MKEWNIRNRSALLEKGEFTEAEDETVNSLIEYYERQCVFFRDSIDDVKRQYDDRDRMMSEFVDERNNMKEAVSQRLLRSLGLSQKPLGWTSTDYNIRNPVDNDDLPAFEEDCDQFVEFIDEEAQSLPCKYPFRRTSDWQLHCTELERVRVTHGEAIAMLKELENAQKIGEMDVDAELKEQSELVKQLALLLKNAVEGVRHAGVPCRSNGSLRYGGSETAETDHNGHGDDPEAVDIEMTPSEIERYVMRSQETVEKWMANADFENDPELLGPPTPQTPWTPEGRVDQLKDIEFGESFQYHSDSDSDII